MDVLDAVINEPAAFVVVITYTAVEPAAAGSPARVIETLELIKPNPAAPVESSVVEPRAWEVDSECCKEVLTGILAVNVLENVKAEPAEFVRVTPNTVVAVERDSLVVPVGTVDTAKTEEPVDSTVVEATVLRAPVAAVGVGTSTVIDV